MPTPHPFDDKPFRGPDDSLGFLLWRVTHAWQRFVDDQLQDCGLTHLQFALMAALGWLTRDNRVATQRHLVEFMQMHPMQVSQVLSLLERKGQVTRARSPVNRRTKQIALTASGNDVLRHAIPVIDQAHIQFFGEKKAGATALGAHLKALAVMHSQWNGEVQDKHSRPLQP